MSWIYLLSPSGPVCHSKSPAIILSLSMSFFMVVITWFIYTSLLWPLLLHPRGFGLSCCHFHWLQCTFNCLFNFLVSPFIRKYDVLYLSNFFLEVDFKFHSIVVWKYARYNLDLFVLVESWFVSQYVTYSGRCSLCTREECVFCYFRMKCPEYIC